MRKRIWALIIGSFFLLVGVVSLFQGDFDVFCGGLIVCAVFILIWLIGNKKLSVPSSRPFPGQQAPNGEAVFNVAGVEHYLENIMSLRSENLDYKKSAAEIIHEEKCEKKLFQYRFVNRPVLLVSEPENPHDAQAMRVDICGKKVGYIYHDDLKSVKKLLRSNSPVTVSAFVSGGKYKIVSQSAEVIESENNIRVTIYIGR